MSSLSEMSWKNLIPRDYQNMMGFLLIVMLYCHILFPLKVFFYSLKHDIYFCFQTLVILVGVVDDRMLTQIKKSSRGNLKTSLFLFPILCQACHGEFYIGKLKEETELVNPPELLNQDDPQIR